MQPGPQRHSTFHEQWFQVEGLSPSLRPDVRIRRQTYWGAAWYIVSEPDNNAHFRLAAEGYLFVSLLDGRRTVQEAWEICQDAGEGEALTQSEAMALLGRLHSAGLLLLDMFLGKFSITPDTFIPGRLLISRVLPIAFSTEPK